MFLNLEKQNPYKSICKNIKRTSYINLWYNKGNTIKKEEMMFSLSFSVKKIYVLLIKYLREKVKNEPIIYCSTKKADDGQKTKKKETANNEKNYLIMFNLN